LVRRGGKGELSDSPWGSLVSTVLVGRVRWPHERQRCITRKCLVVKKVSNKQRRGILSRRKERGYEDNKGSARYRMGPKATIWTGRYASVRLPKEVDTIGGRCFHQWKPFVLQFLFGRRKREGVRFRSKTGSRGVSTGRNASPYGPRRGGPGFLLAKGGGEKGE